MTECDEEKEYFKAYDDLKVHALMLKDEVRTKAYQDAIIKNPTLFQDQVVIDVGAGTGILSIFCAQAGAKRVYAVEPTNVGDAIENIASDNGFNQIVHIKKRIEDCTKTDIPQKADAIVSEWMGIHLLNESMFDSVIFARDKFLKEGGVVYPTYANLYACPVQLGSLHEGETSELGFWRSKPYGINFSSLLPSAIKTVSGKLRVANINLGEDGNGPDKLLAEPENILSLDLENCPMLEEDPGDVYRFTITESGFFDAIAFWFDVSFPGTEEFVLLDTHPVNPPTHWKQSQIVLPERIKVEKDEVHPWKIGLTRSSSLKRSWELMAEQLNMKDDLIACVMQQFINTHPLPQKGADAAVEENKLEGSATHLLKKVNGSINET